MYNEYDEGYEAFQDGCHLEANPYLWYTVEWYDWRRGWFDAENYYN